MTPYYSEEGITIYHGNAIEVLPQLDPVDVILTDTPYGIGLEYSDTFSDTPEYLEALISSSLPMMRSTAPVVALTCGVVNQWKFPPPTWVLCWHQVNAFSSTGFYGFNMWQPILCYGTDPYLKRGLGRQQDYIPTVATLGSRAGYDNPPTGHPCPKPLPSWKKILLRLSPHETDVILDPFMGSGTTLHAAKDLGRQAIGIEIEEKYCEIAAQRLAQGVLNLVSS